MISDASGSVQPTSSSSSRRRRFVLSGEGTAVAFGTLAAADDERVAVSGSSDAVTGIRRTKTTAHSSAGTGDV